ncbi:hypothetical protein Moror_11234 [Moniliophthora roreri MCA 2997]|uniref:Uncharacterized protein n=2 Tax=Moniliophthora roreri TaxID=221103 RepID=V2WQ30_MONRO|nr:hypothetical protein Moror_11234 [Moniliophthora roreri MCA 2997]KAI3606143.1 hypothetical protein WG66_003918 [Moniliophthora roreri]
MSFTTSQIYNFQALFGGIEVPERDEIDEIIELYVDFEGGDSDSLVREHCGGGFEVGGFEEMERILEAFVVTNEISMTHSSQGYVVDIEHTSPNIPINNTTDSTPANLDMITEPLRPKNLNVDIANVRQLLNVPSIKINFKSKSQKENQKVKAQAQHSTSILNERHLPPPSLYKTLSTRRW